MKKEPSLLETLENILAASVREIYLDLAGKKTIKIYVREAPTLATGKPC
jgi:hypothetical protein